MGVNVGVGVDDGVGVGGEQCQAAKAVPGGEGVQAAGVGVGECCCRVLV